MIVYLGSLIYFKPINKTIMIRHASAVWNGSGKEGNGNLTTQSTTLNKTQYSFNSRFAEGVGTNPEELVAAAHAGCFTMKLSFVIGEAGFTPETLETKCELTFENGAITKSHLIVSAKVPGIDNEKFQAAVKNAEANCPISKLLNTAISSEATLL
jgi:osmotically inducible protein OsmC